MKLIDLFEATATGDCYRAAGKYIIENSEYTLVHAEVTGQAHLEGIKYGHAWVEKGNTVIDVSNGRFIKMPKADYYAMGKISTTKGKMFRYTSTEAIRAMVSSKHWGPWDLKTER